MELESTTDVRGEVVNSSRIYLRVQRIRTPRPGKSVRVIGDQTTFGTIDVEGLFLNNPRIKFNSRTRRRAIDRTHRGNPILEESWFRLKEVNRPPPEPEQQKPPVEHTHTERSAIEGEWHAVLRRLSAYSHVVKHAIFLPLR